MILRLGTLIAAANTSSGGPSVSGLAGLRPDVGADTA
jgi:hypothetical protein